MPIWREHVGAQERRISALPHEALVSFSIACVDHAFARCFQGFESVFNQEPGPLDIVKSALDLNQANPDWCF
jgi:hypothetical protein